MFAFLPIILRESMAFCANSCKQATINLMDGLIRSSLFPGKEEDLLLLHFFSARSSLLPVDPFSLRTLFSAPKNRTSRYKIATRPY